MEMRVESGGGGRAQQIRFWANGCLLIKNMTFIIYQRGIALRRDDPPPSRPLIYIKNYIFQFGVGVKMSPVEG